MIVKTAMIPLMVQYQMSVGSTETAVELRVGPVMFGIPMTFPIKSEITAIPVAFGVGQLYLRPDFSHFISSVHLPLRSSTSAGCERNKYRNNVRQTVSSILMYSTEIFVCEWHLSAITYSSRC